GQVIAHVALDALPSLLGRAKRGETLCRLGANRTANGWNPAEHRAFRSQRHRRPAPKAEAVDMAHDQRVGKVEFGIDAVVNRPAGRGKGVPGFPVRAPAVLIGLDVAKLDA